MKDKCDWPDQGVSFKWSDNSLVAFATIHICAYLHKPFLGRQTSVLCREHTKNRPKQLHPNLGWQASELVRVSCGSMNSLQAAVPWGSPRLIPAVNCASPGIWGRCGPLITLRLVGPVLCRSPVSNQSCQELRKTRKTVPCPEDSVTAVPVKRLFQCGWQSRRKAVKMHRMCIVDKILMCSSKT